MPEKTKPEKDSRTLSQKKAKESTAERTEAVEKGNWCEDQQENSYYYDDSYGYEVYVPDEEDEDEKDEK